MNANELPFNTEHIIASLRFWVEAESPSFDAAAVNKVIDLAQYDLAALGATIERLPGRFGFGDNLRATFNPGQSYQEQGAPNGVLICCHADTVHPLGSLQTMPYRREGNKLFGAGVLSAKSGTFIGIEAIRQLLQSGFEPQMPVTVLIVSDKELCCRSSREFIQASAKRSKYVLVPAPTAGADDVILGRPAVLNFELDVKVDTAHELKSSQSGAARSPVYEMARHIVEIENMSTDDCTFTVGSITSGQWANFAEKCSAEVVSLARSSDAVADSTNKMLALNSPNPDIGLHVNRSVTLPLWAPDASSRELFNLATNVGKELKLSLKASTAAHGSIGNITGSMGIATLDGLGASGLAAHRSRAEYLDIDSLVSRGKLIAGLLARLTE